MKVGYQNFNKFLNLFQL